MVNIVIPMAGEGSRFPREKYKKTKPFIEVDGRPMIARVLENLSIPDARYYLIARREQIEEEGDTVRTLEEKYNAKFITIDKLTEGTACTVLFARKFINNDTPLLIANADQVVDIEIKDFFDDCINRELDGSILTFFDKLKDPKWSFAKIQDNHLVSEVREKDPISNYATVGIYLYSKGRHYVDAAIDMIINNDRVGQEFYTCPTYNYAIGSGKRIGIYNIDPNGMHGLGTPDDLDDYLNLLKSSDR